MIDNTEPTIDKIIDELLAEAIEKAITEWAGQEYPNDATFYDVTVKEAKQAITSLIKELVAEAKPEQYVHYYATDPVEGGRKIGYDEAVREFEQKLLKALEEV